MKNRLMRTVLALTTGMIIIGCATITTADGTKMKSQESQDTITELKRLDCITGIIDIDELSDVLEHRKGTLVTEVSNGTVLDDDGNGVDDYGFYRHYDKMRFSKGDRVQSIFVYNPDTNYFDDILSRLDILIE